MNEETKWVKQENADKIYVTRKEAAEQLSVSVRTVQRLVKRGRLEEYTLPESRNVRYLVTDLSKVFQKK